MINRSMRNNHMNNSDFYLECDGVKLSCTIEFPEPSDKTKLPLVILIHGLTGHKDEPQMLAARDGIIDSEMACLRVDMYGHGKSEGDFENHNLLIWINEILNIINYAKSLEFVSELYLAGHSQGALAVMLAAPLKQDQISALLALSPAICLVTGSRNGNLLGYEFDISHIPSRLDIWNDAVINDIYLRTTAALPIERAMTAFTKPVFLLHGSLDEAVPVDDSVNAATVYTDATLKIIENADHCYENYLDVERDAVRDFLMSL